MAVHVDYTGIAGWGETCRGFVAAQISKFPTKNLGELTWYTGCAFKRHLELGTFQIISQKALTERMLNR